MNGDPDDSSRIRFRALRVSDLALLHRWLNSPAVGRWYGQRPWTLPEVQAKYGPRISGREPTRCFLICCDDKPFGYIQTYRIADHPDYHRHVGADSKTAGVDMFIGERAYLHRGFGTASLTKFLKEVVFAERDVTACLVGPDPVNADAIHAYEKAGFRHWKTIQLPDQTAPEYLMRIERQAVA